MNNKVIIFYFDLSKTGLILPGFWSESKNVQGSVPHQVDRVGIEQITIKIRVIDIRQKLQQALFYIFQMLPHGFFGRRRSFFNHGGEDRR